MFGTSTFADAPFASEAGTIYKCVISEAASGATIAFALVPFAVVVAESVSGAETITPGYVFPGAVQETSSTSLAIDPLSVYHTIVQNVAQSADSTSSTFEVNAQALASVAGTSNPAAFATFMTEVVNTITANSVFEGHPDFAVVVLGATSGSMATATTPTFRSVVAENTEAAETVVPKKYTVGIVHSASSGATSVYGKTTLVARVTESSHTTDFVTTVNNILSAQVVANATGEVVPFVIQQLHAVVTDGSSISDIALTRLLWEVINDFKSGTWGTINNAQTVTWGNVSTDTDSGWTEIKTLN